MGRRKQAAIRPCRCSYLVFVVVAFAVYVAVLIIILLFCLLIYTFKDE